MNDLYEIIRFVGNAPLKVLPFFLLSMFLSVLINMLDLTDAIRKAFAGREGLAVLMATAVGAFSPFCSCTVIPIIAGLLLSGVPLAPVMSFWIASPTMDPEIFTLTVGILGWPLALSRLGASLALSLGAGYLTLLLCRLGYFSQILPVGLEQSTQLKTSCCKTQSEAPPIPVTLTVLPTVACCSADRAKAIAVPLPVLLPPPGGSPVLQVSAVSTGMFLPAGWETRAGDSAAGFWWLSHLRLSSQCMCHRKQSSQFWVMAAALQFRWLH